MSHRRTNRWRALALFLMAAFGGSAVAQPQPVVLVTASSVDQLLEKAKHLATVAGMPQMADMVQGALAGHTEGMDTKRPLGIVLLADGDSFQLFGMLPISDVSAWIKSSPLGGMAEETGAGTFKVQAGNRTLFIKSEGDWTYAATSEEDLANHPADPLEIMRGLDEQYDIGVRVTVQNIPVEPRDMALNRMRQMIQFAMQQQASQNGPAAAKAQQAQLDQQFTTIERLTQELDELTLGFSVTPDSEKVAVDVIVNPVADSRFAKQALMMQNAQTELASFFVPKATMTMASCYGVLPEQTQEAVELWRVMMDGYKEKLQSEEAGGDEASRQVLAKALDEVYAVLKASLEMGEVDVAGSVMIEADQLNGIAAGRIANGIALEKIAKDLGEIASKYGIEGKYKWNFAQHQGVNLHAAQFALPQDNDLSAAFGEKLTLFVGTAENRVYVSLGEKSLGPLKSAIDGSREAGKKSAIPMRMLISLQDVLDFASKFQDNAELAEVAKNLEAIGDADRLLMSQKVASSGEVSYRVEVQEKLLSAIGAAYAGQGAAP